MIFPRSTRPRNAIGAPWYVGFADSSMLAYCAVIYAVWTMTSSDGTESKASRIVLAKARVTPLHGTTVPRGEVQGIVILLRLLNLLLSSAATRASCFIVATDSECSVAALRKPGTALSPYFAMSPDQKTQQTWAQGEGHYVRCRGRICLADWATFSYFSPE